MKPIEPETLLEYRFLSQVRLSPDGTKAGLLVAQANLDENDYRSDLWLCPVDTGRPLRLTTSGRVSAFSWEGSGRSILFLQKPREPGQQETPVHRIAIDGGEAALVCTIPLKVESIRPVDECRWLAAATVDLARSPAPPDESHRAFEARQARDEEEKDYQVLDEIPFWRNGRGFTSKKRTHLYLVDPRGGEPLALSEGLLDVQSYDLRGDQVVLAAAPFDQVLRPTNDLYLIDLATRSVRKLTDGTRSFSQPRLLSDGVVVASGSDMLRFGLNQNEELYALHLDDGRLENLTPGWDKSPSSSVGSDCRLGTPEPNRADAGRFYFHTTEGDSCFLNVIGLDGAPRRLIDLPGAVDSFDVRGETLVYVAFRGDRLQELYRWDHGAAPGKREIQLSRLNPEAQQSYAVSTPEHLLVPVEDGVEVDAWFVPPVNPPPGQRYPAILQIHGGPKTVSSSAFFHEYQLLANRGYAVFFCNPRGSDGKGDAFADIRGKYGTVDYRDIVAVVDHVLGRYPSVDPKRLGVAGGSYGGFMTNWIIGHTGRFKAAVSQRSIASWLSFGYTTDIGYYFMPDQVGATPWQDPDKLWFHSPLRYADRVQTPTLFIHSAEDHRCWLPEGIQMFTALKLHGIASRLVIFEGENHELSRSGKPKHRIRRLREILDWFQAYL